MTICALRERRIGLVNITPALGEDVTELLFYGFGRF